MPWLELTFDLPAGQAVPEAVEQACFDAGALSVTLSDAHDDAVLEPAPGEVRLWPVTKLTALFPHAAQQEPAGGLTRRLAADFGIPPERITQRPVPDRQWEREWLRDFHAMRFGRRLWVCPRHEPHPEAEASVTLDPGMAFGTGTHATTALCLTWLDAHLAPGTRVIDYGCGSGILGIAALRLGAAHLWCHDIDPQALLATGDNARANGVEAATTICTRAADLPAEVDLLLANILSGPLCLLAPAFAALVRPGGNVVLCGLMNREVVEVTRAYQAWFHIDSGGERDGWVLLLGSRRAAHADQRKGREDSRIG